MILKDLNKLIYFKEAAELLNYTKSAQKLQTTPSAVQKAVKLLEYNLGHKLFIRKSKGIALTTEGKILYDRVIRSFKELQSAEKELLSKKQEHIKRLKILTTPGLAAEWVYKCFPKVKDTYPDLKIDFLASNVEIELDADDYDIYIGPHIETSKIYKRLPLHTFNFRLYASKDYIKHYGMPKDISDLARHKLIKFSGLLHAYFNDPNKLFSDITDDRLYDFSVDYYLAELRLVEIGLGIASLSEGLVKLSGDHFVDIFPDMQPICVAIFIYYKEKIDESLINLIYKALKSSSPFYA